MLIFCGSSIVIEKMIVNLKMHLMTIINGRWQYLCLCYFLLLCSKKNTVFTRLKLKFNLLKLLHVLANLCLQFLFNKELCKLS